MKITALFGHMKKPASVVIGDTVNEGDLIGIMGNTGKSIGEHLHLGVREGWQNTVFRMSEVEINRKLLRELALFMYDNTLFNFPFLVTYSFCDPKYKDGEGRLVDHMGYDVVPVDRFKTDEHHGIHWPRSMPGTVLFSGYDKGYGNCVLIGYESRR